ncbi:hypothetical protein DFH09DRAFT_1077848 [Mycena vulgaris]|nr:hypothetical protein DFH09DRAFT_1077848 [Mycena vulgaris]
MTDGRQVEDKSSDRYELVTIPPSDSWAGETTNKNVEWPHREDACCKIPELRRWAGDTLQALLHGDYNWGCAPICQPTSVGTSQSRCLFLMSRCDGKLPCQTCRDILHPDECEYRGQALSGKSTPVERGTHGASTDFSHSTNASSGSGSSYSAPQKLRRDSTDNIPTLPDAYISVPGSASLANSSVSWASRYHAIHRRRPLGDLIQGSTALPQDSIVDREAELFAVVARPLPARERLPTPGISHGEPPALRNVVVLGGPDSGRGNAGMHASEVLRRSPHTHDPVTTMQVYSLFALYYGTKGDTATFARLFNHLGDIVLRNLATWDWMIPLHRLSLSARGAVCLFWNDVVGIRSVFGPEAPADARSFHLGEVPTAGGRATHQTDTETNFMRAKNVLVLYDARQLVADWGRWPGESFIRRVQVLALKSCVLVTLGALVELPALFAPVQPESCRKHSEVVQKVATITGMLSLREFQYLDPTLAEISSPHLDARPLHGRCPPCNGISRELNSKSGTYLNERSLFQKVEFSPRPEEIVPRESRSRTVLVLTRSIRRSWDLPVIFVIPLESEILSLLLCSQPQKFMQYLLEDVACPPGLRKKGAHPTLGLKGGSTTPGVPACQIWAQIDELIQSCGVVDGGPRRDDIIS